MTTTVPALPIVCTRCSRCSSCNHNLYTSVKWCKAFKPSTEFSISLGKKKRTEVLSFNPFSVLKGE